MKTTVLNWFAISAAADSRCVQAARSVHRASGDNDLRTVAVFTASDARTVAATGGDYLATGYCYLATSAHV